MSNDIPSDPEYTILREGSRAELERVVVKHLKAGWNPQGGIAVAADASGCAQHYAQAMSKNLR